MSASSTSSASSSFSSSPPRCEDVLAASGSHSASDAGRSGYGAYSVSEADSDELNGRQYTLILDFSDSMRSHHDARGMDGKDHQRFAVMKEATKLFLERCIALDPDGVDVYTFHEKHKFHGSIRTVRSLEKIFDKKNTGHGTRLAPVLKKALDTYFKRRKEEPNRRETIVVITDGRPSSKKECEGQIRRAAKKMAKEKGKKRRGADNHKDLGLQFLQVGRDEKAAELLRKWDDDIEDGDLPDIVDTKNYEAMSDDGLTLEEVLDGAIND